MKSNKKILGDSWYLKHLPYEATNLDDFLLKKHGEFLYRISNKSQLVRGLLFFNAAKEFDLIVTHIVHRGVYVFLALEALFSKNKNRIILLEFIRGNPENKLNNLIWLTFQKLIFAPSLKRSLAKAHVLTLHEKEYYSKTFKVPCERFSFIPWPIHGKPENEPETLELNDSFQSKIPSTQPYVMASGKSNTDWETIFEVAEQSDWQLLAICPSSQLERVNKLNKSGRAIILNDISYLDHGRYLKGALVYALCLKETGVSGGQIRLMNTNEEGVPAVASNITGLSGYAVDGVNALLVPPNNATAFKEAIDRLIQNKELRINLIKSAKEYQQSSTYEYYIESVIHLITDESP